MCYTIVNESRGDLLGLAEPRQKQWLDGLCMDCHQACATVRRAARASATLRQATNKKRLNKRADLYDILAQRLV